MSLRHAVLVVFSLLLLAAGSPARGAWHSLEEIPVESPVYRLVGDLSSSYPLSAGLLLTRPWTRGDVGRLLDQLVADFPAAAGDPAVLRLLSELEPGGGIGGLEPALSADDENASLEVSPYARLSFGEDRSRGTTTRDFRAGLQSSLAFGDRALLYADGYAGTITPGAHGTPDASGSFRTSSTDITPWVDRAYGTWATRGFLLRAGRTWLRWGPGADGGVALSDGAPAFDLLEARARLPGGAQLAWFVASLDPAGETYLAGHRVELRAGPSVQLSFSELARFDGTGNAPLYLLPAVPYVLMERRVRGASSLPADSLVRLGSNNIMYAADFSWTYRPGIRLYGEIAVDDVTLDNSRPFAAGWQAGAHLRRLAGGGAWSLRGEYSRVYAYTYSVSHRHDFAHAGFPTAYPLGPDVERWTARLEWRPDAWWAWGLEASAIRKGAGRLGVPWRPGQPVPTRLVLNDPVDQDQRLALTADWSPSPSVSLAAAGGTATAKSRDNVPRDDADGAFASARATLRW